MHRAHKIRLDPTYQQEEYFRRACGVARFAYNWALAEWQKEYEAGGKPNESKLRKRLNSIKAEQFPWMLEVTKCAPQQAIKNVGTAFNGFFRRVKQGGKPGYPRFKKKGVHDSFRADNGPQTSCGHAVEVVGKTVKLLNCGVVKMREPLRFSGRVLSATISRLADGWYVSLLVDTQDTLLGAPAGSVGVDLGVKRLATLSTGEQFPGLAPHRKAHAKLVRLSRSLNRKKKGSSNRAKAKTKLAKLHKRIADIRSDALHKLTTYLATTFSVVAIENLNVKGMVKNHCLARSVMDVGFAEFRRQLEYKATMTGAAVFLVDRFYPSSQICSGCGKIHKDMASKWLAVLHCECGNVMDRDINAAINLRNKAASPAASACGEKGADYGGDTEVKPFSMKQEGRMESLHPSRAEVRNY